MFTSCSLLRWILRFRINVKSSNSVQRYASAGRIPILDAPASTNLMKPNFAARVVNALDFFLKTGSLRGFKEKKDKQHGLGGT